MSLSMDPRDCVPIPCSPTVPFLGHVLELRKEEEPFGGLYKMAEQHGEIFTVTVFGKQSVVIATNEMLNQCCDERYFEKAIHNALRELRDAVHDGLFTAYDTEPNWITAHESLVPAFGPINVAGMFDSMKDIASQLVLKWLRHGSAAEINVAEDFTRLTFDTIALCAMDYRFNSFYTEHTDQFVKLMGFALAYTDVRGWVPRWMKSTLLRKQEKEFHFSIKYMRDLSKTIVAERVKNPKPDINDLLNIMLNGKDGQGRRLDDESIVDNILTFLIAGHETTSGMLSFTMYRLLQNQEAYNKVREEIDSVVGTDEVRLEHLKSLPYVNAVLRESSRLNSTAPGIGFTPKSKEGAILSGKYYIPHGMDIMVPLNLVHRDRAVFGDNADEFVPERMLDENFEKLPPNAYKTFGNGKRACIGRGFAFQEMLLVMVLLFQHFDFELVDPNYELKIEFTLTVKPQNLLIRAKAREGVNVSGASLGSLLQKHAKKDVALGPSKTPTNNAKPVAIFYGSNSGTCELLARTLAANASQHGFAASRVAPLNAATRAIPEDEPVIIITASYEGQPTDNGAKFFEWLETNEGNDTKTDFAVFGCGHSDWKQTFHRIPKTIDRIMEQKGGHRLCALGLADAHNGDMVGDFQSWEDNQLWPALKHRFGMESGEASLPLSHVTVDISSNRGSQLRSDATEAKVLELRTLTAPDEPQRKMCIVLELPAGLAYRAGDYCAILPFNPPETVHRVMTRFSLPFDAVLKVSSLTGTSLPTDHPVSALDLFGAYVELGQPATRRNISMLIDAARGEKTKQALVALNSDDFNSVVTEKRVSILDLLERHPDIDLPLGSFVASLIPMRVRQYSVASSPLKDSRQVTLVYDVLDGKSVSGGPTRHIGVASNYLTSLRPGDIVHASIKASHQPFHLPEDHTVPIVMIAAGTGIAPFIGFIEERAARIAAGKQLAPAHLFFGCRSPVRDDLYHNELRKWQDLGAVTVHRAYSRAPEQSHGHTHINETLLAERKLLIELWEQGGKLFVCGSRAVGESVKQAFLNIAGEMARDRGEDDAEDCMQKWFEGIRNQRYTTDVFT